MTAINGKARDRALILRPAATAVTAINADPHFDDWLRAVRVAVQTLVGDFVAVRCSPGLRAAGIDVAADVLDEFITGGKCLRSTFMYLGWLCGADDDDAALRAAASLELLHAFALLQDDVMDGSALRRGRASGHVAFARWHEGRGLSGPPQRFGESAATLLGDLCLVWAAQMMRESGMPAAALERLWPRYDAMCVELAVGQFADLVNDAGGFPTLEQVLDIARLKSGNYTVRRPLEMGAAMAGCSRHVVTVLGCFGEDLGEAFQMRDDVLGIFGSPALTGKPRGDDLAEHKATSVVAAAYELADPAQRRQLAELMSARKLADNDVARWQELIAATGAVERIESLIDSRVQRALWWIDNDSITVGMRAALTNMAAACTRRSR